MRENDRERFGILLVAIGEEYSFDWSKPLADSWWEVLKVHDIEDIERAYWRHLADPEKSRFRPHPGELAGMITGDNNTQALSAWSKVERAIRQVGPWYSVVFDNPIIHAVIEDMGGWVQLCNTPSEDELPFKRNEFCTRYRGYIINPPESYPRLLVGTIQAGNASAGYDMAQVKFIGEPNLAKLTFQGGRDGAGLVAREVNLAQLPAPGAPLPQLPSGQQPRGDA